MNLKEFFIMSISGDKFNLDITFFDWYIGFRKISTDKGHYDLHKIFFLCLEFHITLKNKKGRDNDEYRKSLGYK